MHLPKTILSTIAILLGLFVLTAIISTLLTLPQAEEAPQPAQVLHQQKQSDPDTISAETSTVQTPPAAEQRAEVPTPTETVRDPEHALVNILCITTSESGLRPISGSGSIIDPRGVILTNAHIAQYLLLEDYAECVIRQGSPATIRYRAELLYLSPQWIEDNTALLTTQTPRGTGEHDYAFLVITESLSATPLPVQFASVAPDPGASVGKIETVELHEDMPVSIAGYPSEFLPSNTVLQNLHPVSASGIITTLFTFGADTLDLIAIGKTTLAQQGTSGGAVVGEDGFMKALVVTATQDLPLAERTLQAITLGHIERSLKQERGSSSISTLLNGDLGEKLLDFQNTLAPVLREQLREAL